MISQLNILSNKCNSFKNLLLKVGQKILFKGGYLNRLVQERAGVVRGVSKPYPMNVQVGLSNDHSL